MTAGVPECPVFHPTLHDVTSTTFVEYIERLERTSKAFREAGVCRIVAPDGWTPHKGSYSRLNFDLPRCAGRGRAQGAWRALAGPPNASPGCPARCRRRRMCCNGRGRPRSKRRSGWEAHGARHAPWPTARRTRRPIRQHATGRAGLYRTLMVESRSMQLSDFRDMVRRLRCLLLPAVAPGCGLAVGRHDDEGSEPSSARAEMPGVLPRCRAAALLRCTAAMPMPPLALPPPTCSVARPTPGRRARR